jgi:putative transposase
VFYTNTLKGEIMLKAYKYRIYPNNQQKQVIDRILETCRHLYNDFLYERKTMYEYDKTNITYSWQQDSLPFRKRINPFLQEVHSQVLQDVARRVDKAFKNFFRRVKAGETPGYPRYKGKGQYDSITYPQSGFGTEGNKLRLSHIGAVKIKLHRNIEGTAKTCTVIRKNGKYYACFCCEVECKPLAGAGASVGIDMGVTDFCVTSDEQFIAAPRTYRKAEKILKKAQRKVSRRVKDSNRRKKAVRELARANEKVSNQRKDIAHRVACQLVKEYDLIVREKLQVKNMVKNEHLAKSINDAGWGMFFSILDYKAESAGRTVIAVDPRNTSQECYSCGNIVPKKLKERWHNCPYCGYSCHRDVNAARNILKRAIA